MVSALDRPIKTEDEDLEGMVQTDAAINPGNSGGPLLDSHGNVIAINTAIYGPQGNIGLGFALPINRAKGMLEEFARSGNIARPVLGVSVLPVSGDLAEMLNLPSEGGLLIQRIERNSPAQQYGLKGPTRRVIISNYPVGIGGDLIVAIDGQPVDGNDSLTKAMSRKRGGDSMDLTVYRNGRKEQVKVKLDSAPAGAVSLGARCLPAILSQRRRPWKRRSAFEPCSCCLAAGRAASALRFPTSTRRATATLSASLGQPFEAQNCFFDLPAFLS